MTREEIVVGLDIGTTKVGTVIAASDAEGSLRVIGVGSTPSRGIKRGVVVDVEETVAAIAHSVERAAHMAGVRVEGVVAGVTGEHIESSNRHAAVTVAGNAGNTGAVTREDVQRVLQGAALEVPRDREIIHSLPRSFTVDGHEGVLRPIGMTGLKLEVETHIVTGKAPFLQNAVQCVERAGFRVDALVLEPIATAEAVTTPDEREMGVILIDIGGGTSDLAVFHDGSIVYSGVLPVGGNHVTRDIAIGLRTPFEIAENLKLDSGAATREMIPHGEALEVVMAGSNEQLRIPRAILGEIIEARMSELFELAREMMHESGARKRLPGGVILSGGGSLLPGAIELASAVFSMPTRLGYPLNVSGWSDQVAVPQLATGVGLCRFALTQRQSPNNQTAIPPIAALQSRRIWGAIAPGSSATSTETPKTDAPIEIAPIAPSQTARPAEDKAKLNAPPTPADAPAQTDAGAPTKSDASAPNFDAPRFDARPAPARTENVRTESPRAETPRAEGVRETPREGPRAEGVRQDKRESPRAETTRSSEGTRESPRTETPRSEGTRESPRTETPRSEGTREGVRQDTRETPRENVREGTRSSENSREVVRETPRENVRESTRSSESSRENARQDVRESPRPGEGEAARASGRFSARARGTAPVRPTPNAVSSVQPSALGKGEKPDEDEVFRRPQTRPDAASATGQQSWWDKLKQFLGFDKAED